jgi:hypothetical protein
LQKFTTPQVAYRVFKAKPFSSTLKYSLAYYNTGVVNLEVVDLAPVSVAVTVIMYSKISRKRTQSRFETWSVKALHVVLYENIVTSPGEKTVLGICQ